HQTSITFVKEYIEHFCIDWGIHAIVYTIERFFLYCLYLHDRYVPSLIRELLSDMIEDDPSYYDAFDLLSELQRNNLFFNKNEFYSLSLREVEPRIVKVTIDRLYTPNEYEDKQEVFRTLVSYYIHSYKLLPMYKNFFNRSLYIYFND
ncbi:MAG: hypothetical protein N2B06_02410, partial [Clostridium sp.]